ncbi:hypothetical protein [Cupriavidus sp. BIS7]|uniref:hypothetical protein n=1 Tax=Cupriavidus sp. BIS7 TaxID=1217718 RepID=UPI0002E84C20|nr:hypothetical protein [Cupriavidus sp. BIS7]
MQALAILLALAGAACLYLAAPNQVLCNTAHGTGCAPISPRLLGWLGLALAACSAWTMSVPEGWPVGIAAALVALTCSLSAWPFIGVWMQQRRNAARPAEILAVTETERSLP